MKIQVLVFMCEIKFDLTLKKSNFLFLLQCILLFTVIKLLPALRLSRQKTNFFSSRFASIWSCSACFGSTILGEDAVLHLESEPKQHLKQYNARNRRRKMPQPVKAHLTS